MTQKNRALELTTFKDEMKFLEELFCYEMPEKQIAAYWKMLSTWDSGVFKGVCDGVAMLSFKFPAIAMFYKVRNEMFEDRFAGAK